MIANRVAHGGEPGAPSRADRRRWATTWPAKVLDSYEASRRLAERDQANLDLLRRRLGRTPMIEVPHLEDDVHDLDGLRRMDEYLFGRG